MTSLHQSPAYLGETTGTFIDARWRHRLLAFTFPLAWVLGTLGYLHYPQGPEPVALSNAIYHAAQLFILHAPHFETPVPWTLELARWLAAASTGWVLVETTWAYKCRFFHPAPSTAQAASLISGKLGHISGRPGLTGRSCWLSKAAVIKDQPCWKIPTIRQRFPRRRTAPGTEGSLMSNGVSA